METTKRKRTASRLLIVLTLMIMAFASMSVQAATLGRPKIDKKSAYLNKTIYLKWSKVSGAKKYEIQRARVKAATGKIGKWAAWATTKKTSIKKAGSGDYKYRVRAVKGSTKGKWSAAKRIFGASAKITHIGYTEPDVFLGVTLSEGKLELRVLVANKTTSDMGFVESGTRFDKQSTIYAFNKTTGKVMKKWAADLDTGSLSAIAKVVEAKKKQTIYIEATVTAEEWAKYKNCKFMVTTSFYPNPEVEPLTTQMAIAYGRAVADSAVAAK